MKKGITKISFLLWVLAVSGFISSTMHYHGVGHNCDEHSEETEHTENESLCSLCVINIVPPTTGSTIVEVPIVQEDTIFSFYSLIINKSTTSFKPERAPPVVA